MSKSWVRDIRTVLQEISGGLLLAIKKVIWAAVYTIPVILVLSSVIFASNILFKKELSIVNLSKIYELRETQGSKQGDVTLEDLKFASKIGDCKQKYGNIHRY